MKKCFLIALLVIAVKISAQESERQQLSQGVEKSIFGVQTGFIGLWGFHEARLSSSTALRSEIGLDGGLSIGYRTSAYVLTPVFSLEPRWYYNINKRERKERNTDNNSANYFSLRTGYHPGWFALSNQEGQMTPGVFVIPHWGMRRNISENFHFEGALGIGYGYSFRKSVGYAENSYGTTVSIRLAFGFNFN